MTRQEALAAYRRHGLLLAQCTVREDVALKLLELDEATARANHLPGLSAAYAETTNRRSGS